MTLKEGLEKYNAANDKMQGSFSKWFTSKMKAADAIRREEEDGKAYMKDKQAFDDVVRELKLGEITNLRLTNEQRSKALDVRALEVAEATARG